MKYLFRIDDICPTMNFENFNLVINIFKEHNIKPLLGVVPFNEDISLKVENECNDFWKILKNMQDKGYPIALHGYNHVYDSRNSGLLKYRKKSEFAGNSYENQCKKIVSGLRIFKMYGLHTDIFMAPGHTYDETTIKCLLANNINYITDGYDLKIYKQFGMKFIPCWLPNKLLCFNKGINTICIHTNTITKDYIDKYIYQIITNNEVISYSDVFEQVPRTKNILIFWYIALIKKMELFYGSVIKGIKVWKK